VLGKDKLEGSTHFLRIKIPNGRLTSKQFRAIAALSETYVKGYAEITDRQNIQLHWIDPQNAQTIFNRLDEIGFSTDHGGQGVPVAQKGDVRAIASCPIADVDKDAIIDTMPLVKQLDAYFDGNTAFLDMPRKLKISLNGCSLNCGNHEMQDLSFVAVKRESGAVGFAVFVGGTVATSPQLARPLNVIVSSGEVLDVARAVAEIFRDMGSREVKAKARFRWLVDALGTEKLRQLIEEKLAHPLETFQPKYLPTHKGEHVGVQTQKQAGCSFINVPIIGGVLSAEKMLELAQVAEDFGDGTMCLTPFQNVIIINIPEQSIDKALCQLSNVGFSLDVSPLRWTTIACAGNFCGKTLDHPKNRAKEAIYYLEQRFGQKLANLPLSIGFSGCLNGCARHLLSDVGLQGTAVNVEGKNVPAYNLYLREEHGETPTFGKLVQRSINAEQIKYVIANLIEAYLSNPQNMSFNKYYSTKTVEQIQEIIKQKR
jgi:sulfite reductase beta subunit-like hemoprotein